MAGGKSTMTGAEIVAEMRRHHATITRVAEVMQITQKRVREVRAKGVVGSHFVTDWKEGIAKATS